MNLMALLSLSWVAWVWSLFRTNWIVVSRSLGSVWSSCSRASTKSSSLVAFQLYLALVRLSTDSLGFPSVNMSAWWSESTARSGFTVWFWTIHCPCAVSFANVRLITMSCWVLDPDLVWMSLSLHRLNPWPSSQFITSCILIGVESASMVLFQRLWWRFQSPVASI